MLFVFALLKRNHAKKNFAGRLGYYFCLLFVYGMMFGPTTTLVAATGEEISPLSVEGILGVRGQKIHSAGLGAVHRTVIEEYLGLNLRGQLHSNVDFTFSLNLLRPNDENNNPYYVMGKRLLDNLVLDLQYKNWQTRMGFLWGSLSPFTLEVPVSKRPLLFDRDPEAGEESPEAYYQRVFKEGFLKEGVLDTSQYFSGGRGGYFWIHRPLMGIHIENSMLPYGGYFKIYSGKAEAYFSEGHYLSEHGGQVGIDLEKAAVLEKTKVEIDIYNRSNDRGEILGQGSAPSTALENNTVIASLFALHVRDYYQLEAEFAKSYFDTAENAWEDWALRLINTLFIEKMVGLNNSLVVSVIYKKVNPDFIGKRSAVLDNGVFHDSQRGYISNVGDFSLLYNNEESWQIDTKFGGDKILLRLILGGRRQIHDTNNQVASTHYLDGIHYNGALWWHVFWSNFGQEANPAAQMYSENAQGSRKIETGWWRGNTETIFLNDTVSSRKYMSFLGVDLRPDLNTFLGFKNFMFFQIYTEFQSLYPSVRISPFFESSVLFYQSYTQCVLVYQWFQPLFILAEYGIENWLSEQADPNVKYFDDSIGLGLDYILDERTFLYFRWKHFEHRDQIVNRNNFSAEQFWVELKTYF